VPAVVAAAAVVVVAVVVGKEWGEGRWRGDPLR
jgi:hypothetical protein